MVSDGDDRATPAKPPPPRFDPATGEGAILGRWAALDSLTLKTQSDREAYRILIEPFQFDEVVTLPSYSRAIVSDVQARFVRMRGPLPSFVFGLKHGMAPLFPPRNPSSPEKEAPADSVEERFEERMSETRVRASEAQDEVSDAFLKLGLDLGGCTSFFTMGAEETSAVYRAFMELHDRDLLYRDKDIIRWCIDCRTALSESEVDAAERDTRFWFVRYPIVGEVERFVNVATAFPETIPGDCALMISPEDPNNRDFLDMRVLKPVGGGEIPVVTGQPRHYKGSTGVRRVTPGERKPDFDLARSMGIATLPLFTSEGLMAEGAGKHRGLERHRARESVLAELEEAKLLDRAETHKMEEEVCVRCGKPVMPLISEQWFIRMKQLACKVTDRLGTSLSVRPSHFENELRTWADNVQDWCISRQNLFGQRIPVLYCLRCGTPDLRIDDAERCSACGNKYMRREHDVIDPTFAACVAPLAALGWPEAGLREGHPLFSLVAVGRNNLISWAARSIALASELTGADFCRRVLVQGSVAIDASPTPGDGTALDSAISGTGADSVRLSVCGVPREGQDDSIGAKELHEGLQFVNKVWNASRFLAMNGSGETVLPGQDTVRLEDSWILGRMSKAIGSVTASMDRMEHDEALAAAIDFMRNDLCGWYLEMIKPHDRGKVRSGVLATVLYAGLRLVHPFAPFVTDASLVAILRAFPEGLPGMTPTLAAAPWPQQVLPADPATEQKILEMEKIVRAVRSVKSVNGINERTSIDLHVSYFDRDLTGLLVGVEHLLTVLLRLSSLNIGANITRPPACVTGVFPDFQVYVGCPVRCDTGMEIERLRRRISRLEDALIVSSRKLEAREFLTRAPAEVIDFERARKEKISAQIEHLRDNLDDLKRAGLTGG